MHTIVGLPATLALPKPEFLAELAEADPHGVAVGDGRREVTNSQLEASSNRLARTLIAVGAGAGTNVIVALEPSIESVVAMWAVRKTGANAVFVRSGDPFHILGHGVSVGVTTSRARAGLPETMVWLLLDHPALLPEYNIATDSPRTGETIAA
jgi:non-ribosomal peptide synthetase component F